MSPGSLGRLEFGGPDLPARRLRDLLQTHIENSPAGSRIDWATYYFRDRALAESLMRASDRGVQIRIALEFSPRRQGANDEVIAMLSAHGLGGGLHRYRRERRKGSLHAKIYAFSQPDVAWIGSFNPSGDDPESPEVIAEIGDQDRGHNVLLGIERPQLTDDLRQFIGELCEPPLLPLPLRLRSWRPVSDSDTRLYYFPRQITGILEPAVAKMGTGDRIRAAISHMKPGLLAKALKRAARQGASISLLLHDTERRVPSQLVEDLSDAGIGIQRIHHPDGLPMHAKFVLLETCGRQQSWLGSYNFNKRSRTANAELLVGTGDAATFETLADRFEQIRATSCATTA